MSYPKTPFVEQINTDFFQEQEGDRNLTISKVDELLEWLCRAPQFSCYRVNTLKTDVNGVLTLIKKQVDEVMGPNSGVEVKQHSLLDDVIIINNWTINKLEVHSKEVVVDMACGAALLRGAHIYAPGVLAMLAGTKIGDRVSIYTDLAHKCKKGLAKIYTESKLFIANGLVMMDRNQLYSNSPTITGVAVKIEENIAGCPPLGDDFLAPGTALLQNLPSIICGHVLGPQITDSVLDMCAAPGNKTTHLAALMHNKGKLVAIDKTKGKIEQLRKRCSDFGASGVEIIMADSTKLLEQNLFEAQTFDRILLDAPCSALGQRPQFINTTPIKVLKSYPPLQKKLFETAVRLLKPGGTLVYSTCTVTLAENEGLVAWALRHFPELNLVRASQDFCLPGWSCTGLTVDQQEKLLRFGPEHDSIGFFIAKFMKSV